MSSELPDRAAAVRPEPAPSSAAPSEPSTDGRVRSAYQRDGACLNCGMPLAGPYCHGCGQKDLGVRLEPVQLVGDFLSYLTQWDGQLVRTVLGLSLRPARVCLDYIEGKRVRYVNPFKYCLTITALFLLFTSYLGYDPSAVFTTEMASQQQAEFARQARAFVFRHLSSIIFLALPLFAWILSRIYRRSGRSFADCYVFALFVIGHAFLLGLILSSASAVVEPEWLLAGRLLTQLAFLAWAAVGFFGGSKVRTVLLALLAQAAYMSMVMLVATLLVLARLLLLGAGPPT